MIIKMLSLYTRKNAWMTNLHVCKRWVSWDLTWGNQNKSSMFNVPIVSLPTPFAPTGTLELFSFFPSSRISKSAYFSLMYLSVHSVKAFACLAAPRKTTALDGSTYFLQKSWGEGISSKSSTRFVCGGLWEPSGFKWPTGTTVSLKTFDFHKAMNIEVKIKHK